MDDIVERARRAAALYRMEEGTVLPERLDEMADEIERLRADRDEFVALINELGLEVMHPDMGGHHQVRVRAHSSKLSPESWATIYRVLGSNDE